MKNQIYWTFFLAVLIISIGVCFKYYIETHKLVAENCGHRAITQAVIVGPSMNGLNENGEDVSCYVEYSRDGHWGKAQKWNVGKCDVGRVIDYDYNSYVCL